MGRGRPEGGYLELEWAPGTAQVDFGNFRATVAGRAVDPRLLMVTLPHSNARLCVALPCKRAEVFFRGTRAVFERIGRAPLVLVLDNATEVGRMALGKVTESSVFIQAPLAVFITAIFVFQPKIFRVSSRTRNRSLTKHRRNVP